MFVRVSVVIFVVLETLASVDSLNMTEAEFVDMGGLRICYGDFDGILLTICQTLNRYAAKAHCCSIHVEFSDMTVQRNVLVCKGVDDSVIGCAYATANSGTEYGTMAYNRGVSTRYCY